MKNWIINLLIKLGLKKGPITVSEAIRIVENAPEDKWTTGSIENEGRLCFIGHLAKARKMRTKNKGTSQILDNSNIEAIDKKIVDFVKNKHHKYITRSWEINDNTYVNGYNEDHPKFRMLHVLNDMKEAGIE